MLNNDKHTAATLPLAHFLNDADNACIGMPKPAIVFYDAAGKELPMKVSGLHPIEFPSSGYAAIVLKLNPGSPQDQCLFTTVGVQANGRSQMDVKVELNGYVPSCTASVLPMVAQQGNPPPGR